VFIIIVGWPLSVRQSGRQVIKTGGDLKEVSGIADGTTPIVPRSGWTNQVFAQENKE